MHAHRVGWGGGPSDFIGKDTGGGSFPEAFKSSLARDFEFHSSADGFAATRTASCRAGRRILGGIVRRAAYISILIGLWLFSMAALMLGMDSFGRPPFFPHALLVGGYWAALWRSPKSSSNGCLRRPRNPQPCCPRVAAPGWHDASTLISLASGTGKQQSKAKYVASDAFEMVRQRAICQIGS
jgi:hypothetical protein